MKQKQQALNELQDPVSDLASKLKSFMTKHDPMSVAKKALKKRKSMFGVKEGVITFKEYLEHQQ